MVLILVWGSGAQVPLVTRNWGGLTVERGMGIQWQEWRLKCLGFRQPWDPNLRRAQDPLVLRHQGDTAEHLQKETGVYGTAIMSRTPSGPQEHKEVTNVWEEIVLSWWIVWPGE